MSGEGRVITTAGPHIDPATGAVVEVRAATTIQDSQSFTLELQYAAPGGAEPRRVRLTHTRRDSASPR
jgi:hypothetical protein